MKKIILSLAIFACLSASVYGQSSPPILVTEVDGSPRVNGVTKIVVSNGSLTVSGKTATIVTGGGGGSGCTPPGTASRVLYDDGAGGCTSTSGLTATASTVTIVSGVTATFSRAGLLYTGTVTTDAASVQTMLIQGDRATPTGNDEAYVTYRLSNAAGTQTEVARQTWAIPTATAASEDGRIDWSVRTGGVLSKELQLAGADLSPSTNDGLALGTTSLQWSDLFLASGSVIDFANGDMTITHSANALTVSGGDLLLTSASTTANSVATIDGSQPLTNKTLTSSTNTLGSVTMDVTGTDANGDTYYRASGVLSRLGIGTAGQCLKTNAGATAPEWGACGGSGGIEVGVTTVTSGTAGRLFYEDASNLLGQVSGATSNGSAVTFTSGNLIATDAALTTPAITTSAVVTRNSLGVTNATGLELTNTTAAAAGAQQISPDLVFTAQGWKTTATAASQTVNWRQYVLPVQGTTNPAVNLVLASQVNGGGYTDQMTLRNSRALTGIATVSSVLLADATAIVWNNAQNPNIRFSSFSDASAIILGVNSNDYVAVKNGLGLASDTSLRWTSSSTVPNTGDDLYLRRAAAASLAFGAADAASPVAQTLSVQNVVTGTTDTAGANWTHNASRGTGTGVGGDYIIQTAPAAAGTGTTQNALAAAFTVKGNGAVQLKSVTFTNLPTVANGYLIYCSDCTEANPCASGGSGALAKGINGVWRCD